MRDDYLQHYGVQGMRWGVRNYQNKDGSLTAQGRRHYDVGQGGRNALSGKALYNRAMAKAMDVNANYYSKRNSKYAKTMAGIQKAGAERARKDADKAQLEANKKAQARQDKRNTPEYKAKARKAMTIGGTAAAAVLAGVGAKLIYDKIQYNRGYKEGYALAQSLVPKIKDYKITKNSDGQWVVDTLLDNGMGGTAVYRKGIEFDEVVSNMLKYKG